jgi:DNA polymerase-3 subunit delta'
VVIIDEADRLEPSAQNALLKTLEEPPSASVFVLVTSRPDVLLPTVLSRCQRVRFGRLAPDEMAEVLVRAHGFTAAEARAAASVADGSLGVALEEREAGAGDAREAAGRLLQSLAAARDARRRLDSVRELVPPGGRPAEVREEVARRLRALSSLLRDLEVLSARADERWLANADLKAALQALLKAFDRDRVLRAFSAVDRALAALERNASPKVVADWLAFQL